MKKALTSILITLVSLTTGAGQICDVKTFGAKGDGTSKDTLALQAAIDSCAGTGGTVVLHDGTYLTGMLTLKSNIELKVESSAILKGTQDDQDYPYLTPATNNSQLLNCRKALLYAEGTVNLRIDGGGIIDGNGANPNWIGKEATRPMAIFIVLSENVSIQNISVKNAGMWSVVNMETNHLSINGLNVNSPNGPTRDGIDIVDCHDVVVENSNVFSEDDSICLKSGSSKGVEDVIVRNSHVLQSSVANALKLGTASTGTFRNILFDNIQIDRADKAAMAVESVDGAVIDGVTFKNIHFQNTGTAAFVLLGQRGSIPQVGSIQNITFQNIQGNTFHTWGSAISGTLINGVTYAPENIHFEQVQVTSSAAALTSLPASPPEYIGQYPDPNLWGNLPAYGFYFRHVKNLLLDQVQTLTESTNEVRPPIVQVDTSLVQSTP